MPSSPAASSIDITSAHAMSADTATKGIGGDFVHVGHMKTYRRHGSRWTHSGVAGPLVPAAPPSTALEQVPPAAAAVAPSFGNASPLGLCAFAGATSCAGSSNSAVEAITARV
jgi:hypothetical protein